MQKFHSGDDRQEVLKKHICGVSLVVQWLRICLAMQGTQVQFLVGIIGLGVLSLCTTASSPCPAVKDPA